MRAKIGISVAAVAGLFLTVEGSQAGSWSTSCTEGTCVVSKFVTDPLHANFDVGAIFSAKEGLLNLRLLTPLGSDVVKGVYLDLDREELGVAPVRSCPPAGCLVDIKLNAIDFVPFSLASELGVTVWELDGRPYRIGLSLDGLKEGVETIYDLEQSKVDAIFVSYAAPEIAGIANVALSSVLSNDVGVNPCSKKVAGISFEIKDKDAIKNYTLESSKFIVREINRHSPTEKKYSSNFDIYPNVTEEIGKIAKEYASTVNIDEVKIDTGNLDFVKEKCLVNGIHFADNTEYSPRYFTEVGLNGWAEAQEVRWISDLTLSADGSQYEQTTPVSQFALKAFSSAVMQRALDERYGVIGLVKD